MKLASPDPISARGSGIGLSELANLDFLRSVAVLLVFGSHYFDIQFGLGKNGSFLWHLGQLGVLIFFVHTSLVLMWSLERSNLPGRQSFAPFYVRRALRIYPLSIVCVLFAYYFDARWVPANLLQNLTLTQYLLLGSASGPRVPPTVTPLWSLPLEIEMYVALPVLFLIFRNRSVKLLAATWGASVALACIQPRFGEGFAILRYVPCFLAGVMAWRLIRERDRQWLPAWLWPFAIALVSLIWMVSTEKHLSLFIAAFGLFLGLAIPLFLDLRWDKLKVTSKIIARYSYSIYLSHFPIMVYITNSHTPDHPPFRIIPPMPLIRHYARPINAFLIVGLTAVASLTLYHGIEEPGIRLGRAMAQWIARGSNQREMGTPIVKAPESSVAKTISG
jgi:peptidoglycan/LPS O-acetylase OafA/YrhL